MFRKQWKPGWNSYLNLHKIAGHKIDQLEMPETSLYQAALIPLLYKANQQAVSAR